MKYSDGQLRTMSSRLRFLLVHQDGAFFTDRKNVSETKAFKVKRRLTMIANLERKSLSQVESEIRRAVYNI